MSHQAATLQAIVLQLQLDPHNLSIQSDFKEVKDKLIEFHHREHMDLQQCAHASWIKEGDQRTNFFTQAIKSWQARNSIMGTIDNRGNQTNSLEEMKRRATEYFDELFSAQSRPRPIPNLNINIIGGPDFVENAKLRAIPSTDEICDVVKNLPRNKAPRMDGLTSEIVAHHWQVMKKSIIDAITYFFSTKRLLRSLNLATLTLIPKVRVPERLKDYRPISCVGVVYKILSKILSVRLMFVLPKLISDNQTAFIRGRRISDAIRLA